MEQKPNTKPEITKEIKYKLTSENYKTIKKYINKEQLQTKREREDPEFKKTIIKFFPEEYPVGIKSNIEICQIETSTGNHHVFCHLNIFETAKLQISIILHPYHYNDKKEKLNPIEINFRTNYKIYFE